MNTQRVVSMVVSKKKSHLEGDLQMAVAKYLRLQYPDILWFHTPNEGKRRFLEAVRLKKMGVLSGVSDILIFQANKDYVGLAIELKIKPNSITPSQRNFQRLIMHQGWACSVCYTFEEAKKEIDNYLKP